MPIINKGGRPSGRLIHAEAFEAIVAARGTNKKVIAAASEISASYLADLLAHRCGASEQSADRIAVALGVKVAAIFPEASGWIAPLPDRDATRPKPSVAA